MTSACGHRALKAQRTASYHGTWQASGHLSKRCGSAVGIVACLLRGALAWAPFEECGGLCSLWWVVIGLCFEQQSCLVICLLFFSHYVLQDAEALKKLVALELDSWTQCHF
jgi:hypothetical protein